MRSTRLLPILFALVPAIGCGDDIKFPDQTELPDPALNGVFPAKGFTDRTVRVEISGDATEFTGTPTVSFGADIAVANVTLASPSTLFADITIAGAAAIGKRDVTVTNGADPLVLTAAFEVQNPLEIVTDGPALQWGRNVMLIINHDPETPFLGTLEITGGTGVNIIPDETTQTESIILADVFIDDNGASGPIIVNDILLDTSTSRGGILEVTPRTPTALGVPASGPAEFQTLNATLTNTTAVFTYTTNAAGFWRTEVTATTPPSTLFSLPNGKWANATIGSSVDMHLLASGVVTNLVVFDDFATGSVFDITADNNDPTGAVALAETEDNDGFFDLDDAEQIPAGQDKTLFTGLLNSDDSGFDDIAITVAENDQIRVSTGPVDPAQADAPDTVVFIFDEDFNLVDGNGFETDSFCCGNVVGLALNDDANSDFASDVTSAQLPAGRYVVEVADSFFILAGFQPNDVPYQALITVIHNP